MFEFFSYESVRKANEERLRRSLNRYETHRRTSPSEAIPTRADADVVELVFPEGCSLDDQLSA